jgi:hypothetical protein
LPFGADEDDAISIDLDLFLFGRVGCGMVFGKDQTEQGVFGARSPFDLFAGGPLAHYVPHRFGFCQAKMRRGATISFLPVHSV